MKIEIELKQYEAEKLRKMIDIQTITAPDIVVKSLIKMLLSRMSKMNYSKNGIDYTH